jgi:hypothetical protein
MVCFLALSVRLWHGTDKLSVIGAHNIYVRQALIQDFAKQSLGRFARAIANLLPIPRECSLGWPIGYRKHHSFGDCCSLWWGCDAIRILGNDAEIELFLSLFRHRKAERMS